MRKNAADGARLLVGAEPLAKGRDAAVCVYTNTQAARAIILRKLRLTSRCFESLRSIIIVRERANYFSHFLTRSRICTFSAARRAIIFAACTHTHSPCSNCAAGTLYFLAVKTPNAFANQTAHLMISIYI